MSDNPITVTPKIAAAINRFLQERAAAHATPPAGVSPNDVWIPNNVDFSRFVGGRIYPENGNIVAEITYPRPAVIGPVPVEFYLAEIRAVVTPYTGRATETRTNCPINPPASSGSTRHEGKPWERSQLDPEAAAVLFNALFHFWSNALPSDSMRDGAASLRQEMGLPPQ